jgi:hypothetical protein
MPPDLVPPVPGGEDFRLVVVLVPFLDRGQDPVAGAFEPEV